MRVRRCNSLLRTEVDLNHRRRRHGDERLLVVAGPLTGQILQGGPFGFDALGVMGVLAADDLADEAAATGEVVEVAGAAHQQGACLPERAVRALDGRLPHAPGRFLTL